MRPDLARPVAHPYQELDVAIRALRAGCQGCGRRRLHFRRHRLRGKRGRKRTALSRSRGCRHWHGRQRHQLGKRARDLRQRRGGHGRQHRARFRHRLAQGDRWASRARWVSVGDGQKGQASHLLIAFAGGACS
eukprot:2777386-Alexandrium_andersonii.AAC.1